MARKAAKMVAVSSAAVNQAAKALKVDKRYVMDSSREIAPLARDSWSLCVFSFVLLSF